MVTGTGAYQGAEAGLPALHTETPPLGMQTAEPAGSPLWDGVPAGSRGQLRLGAQGAGGRGAAVPSQCLPSAASRKPEAQEQQ